MNTTYQLHPVGSERAKMLSDAITFLKFPLAVLVVMLHCDISTKPIEQMGVSLADVSEPYYSNISWLLSRYLAYAAVPCFFIISGFLLFYNVEKYSKQVYFDKLKKRCKSLLLPYIVWCLIYLILFWIIGQEKIILSDKPNLFDGSLSPFGLVVNIFVKPLDGPLWFIRNLFVMVVFSPLLYLIIKRTKYLLPLAFLVLTQILHSPIIESILWFSFGICFAVHKFDFLYFCRRWLIIWLLIALISVIVDFVLYPELGIHISRHFSIFKVMSVFGVGHWCVTKQLSWSEALNSSSFVIYAYHGLAVLLSIPAIYNLVKPLGGALILTYFLSIFSITAIGILLSVIINKNKIIRSILCGR